jgi:hypothetical protein
MAGVCFMERKKKTNRDQLDVGILLIQNKSTMNLASITIHRIDKLIVPVLFWCGRIIENEWRKVLT